MKIRKLARIFTNRFRLVRYFFSKSDPYLSGDSKAKSVSVPSNILCEFFSLYGHLLNETVVISGNSDINFEKLNFLPLGCKKLYLQNSAISDNPRIGILPIGLENAKFGRGGLKKFYIREELPKFFNKILIPPMANTNSIRLNVLAWAKKNSEICEYRNEYLDINEYIELVNEYLFVFCAEGNGYDTHRLWETLYLNSFPIVLNTRWSKSLKDFNLPILFVDSLEELTKEKLDEHRRINVGFSAINHEILWIKYWKDVLIKD